MHGSAITTMTNENTEEEQIKAGLKPGLVTTMGYLEWNTYLETNQE